MADKKNITQAVIEAANMVIMAAKKAEHLASTGTLAQMMSRPGGSALKQPTFDWRALENTKNCDTLKQW